MADDDTLLGPIVASARRLADDVRAAAALRWQLARLELSVAARDVARLAIALAVAFLLVVISLPILLVALADLLSGTWGIDRTAWLLIFFAALVVAAVCGGWWAWRRFKRTFVGLEETLEVLQEDLDWLRKS